MNETITITRNGKTYEVDFEKAEKLGVLKEKVEYPKTWDELKMTTRWCSQHCSRPGKNYAFSVDVSYNFPTKNFYSQATEEEADAFSALGKLIQLRDWWWDNMCNGWRPNSEEDNYVIIRSIGERGNLIIDTDESWGVLYTLSFPTEKIRDKFLEAYRDLIETAKMFL